MVFDAARGPEGHQFNAPTLLLLLLLLSSGGHRGQQSQEEIKPFPAAQTLHPPSDCVLIRFGPQIICCQRRPRSMPVRNVTFAVDAFAYFHMETVFLASHTHTHTHTLFGLLKEAEDGINSKQSVCIFSRPSARVFFVFLSFCRHIDS